jgi:hypothetical protein
VSETAEERSKRLRAERNRRYRERVHERAEDGEALPPSVQALADRDKPRHIRPSDDYSSGPHGGRILGVLALPGPAAILQGAQPEVVYSATGRVTPTGASYVRWLDERDAAAGRGRYRADGSYVHPRRKPPERDDRPCRVKTPVGSYNYDLTLEDINRLAPIVAEEVGARVNAVREAMANCRSGQTVVLSA